MKSNQFIIMFLLIGISFSLSVKASEKVRSSTLSSVIEIVGEVGEELSPSPLRALEKKYGLSAASIYRWKNHLVVYSNLRTPAFRRKINKLYPRAKINYYESPFYVFDRTHCKDSNVSKEWDNILLTANLVKDTALQQEYMQYHATQYQEWPEVSNGFCNADFQQLLVFRTGRQLMLVISIPKGKTLDELNPKTTEGNPRVDEWNRRMSKYQEGLPEAAAGEVWSFLLPIR